MTARPGFEVCGKGTHTPPKTYIEFPATALAWYELQTFLHFKTMIFIKIALAPSEIWQP